MGDPMTEAGLEGLPDRRIADLIGGGPVRPPPATAGRAGCRGPPTTAHVAATTARRAGVASSAAEAAMSPNIQPARPPITAPIAATPSGREADSRFGGTRQGSIAFEHREFGEEVVELEHEADVAVAVGVQPAAPEVRDASTEVFDRTTVRIGSIEAPEEVEEGALAASTGCRGSRATRRDARRSRRP